MISTSYILRKKRRVSKRGRRMANARWQKFHAKREALAAKDPIRVGGKIVERLVRIIGERRVIERTFYEHDRAYDWKRKRRELFAA